MEKFGVKYRVQYLPYLVLDGIEICSATKFNCADQASLSKVE
jgi:hypothetical protein